MKNGIGPKLTVAGILFLLLATNPGRIETVDTRIRLDVARSIWQQGRVTIDPPDTPYFRAFTVPSRDGMHRVAHYAPGQSLLLIPFDIVGERLERGVPPESREKLAWLPVAFVFMPLVALAWWLGLRLLSRELGADDARSAVEATLVFLATLAFHYAGQSQEECLVGALVAGALGLCLRSRRTGSVRVALGAGLLAGGALATRPVAVFALASCVVLALPPSRSRLRSLAAFAAGVVPSVALLLAYNWLRFGNVLSSGYDRLGHFAKMRWDLESPGLLVGLLAGPGAGLLVLSPLLLLVFPGFRALWGRDRALALAVLVSTSSCLLFFSGWRESIQGGTAWGTRYQVHLISVLAVPLLLGWRSVAHGPWRGVLGPLAVLSGFLAVASTVLPHHLEFDQHTCDGGAPWEWRELLLSPTRGQLERRAVNLATWLSGGTDPRLTAPVPCASRPAIARMWEAYAPNYWGPVYSRRLAGRPRAVVLLAWWTCVALGVGLTGLGLARSHRAAGEVPEPPG